ncbi:MAG: hypothetical protein LAT82_02355 [Nanoarchaeota archaeon]|nr:hypothetical protein [Nanoarchaeota archaeon]
MSNVKTTIKKSTKSNTSSSNENSKVHKQSEAIVFDAEISKMNPNQREELEKIKPFLDEFNSILFEKSQGKAMGMYIVPEIEQTQQGFIPNFSKLKVHFLLDDFEKPVPEFNAKILLQDAFDSYLKEEIKKDSQTQEEYVEYSFKKFKDWKFIGTSISILRENCFDSMYDDLKNLGSSIIFSDYRGFISALKSIDIHRNMLLQKFEKYVVVYAGAGSWLRGEKSNDFDVFVVVDDTDVKRMSRLQVKDQLTRIIWQMAQDVAQLTGINLHTQVYLLTDFWDALKDAHPVMFTFLRDGVPFYDRGLYSAWKELLKLGKIRPSPEAIDLHMNGATQLMDRAKKTMQEIAMQDIYYAVLNPAQAMLMLKGYNPTTPKETVRIYEEVLFKKEKFVSEKEAQILKDTVAMFKAIEHDKSYNVSGKELDKRLKDAEFFLKKSKEQFEMVTNEKTIESVESAYQDLLGQVFKLEKIDSSSKSPLLDFITLYVKTGKVHNFVEKSIKEIEKVMSQISSKNLSSLEANKVIKEIRNVASEIKLINEESYMNKTVHKISLIFKENKRAELFSTLGVVYVHNLENSKVFELDVKNKVSKEVTIPQSFEYEKIQITSELIDTVKKTLDVEEIFF